MSTLKKDEESGKGEEKDGTKKAVVVRNIQPTSNWNEWIGLWESTLNLQWKESLLHEGFKIPLGRREFGEREYDEIDRLAFYFAVADGWTDASILRFPEDEGKEYRVGCDSCGNAIRKTPSELRQELARKAFDMLCLNFFKTELLVRGRHGDEFGKEWERIIASEQFFPVIQNFFRVQEARLSDRIEIRNLFHRDETRSHNERLAVDFLVNLAKFIWGWREPDDEHYYSSEDKKKERREYLAATRSRIDAAKPWMIEVLAWLDRIDVLRKWILELDKACLAKLKEIAMRNEFDGYYPSPVRERRPVVTLDEACYLGSKAAWFLKEHELRIREHKRLTAIQEAEKQIKEAGQKIEQLSSKK